MKRTLFTLFLILLSSMAFAVEVEIDGINYNIVKKGKYAEVIKKKGESYKGNVIIPSTVEYEGVTCNVEAVSEEAFYDCYHLTSVTLPESVKSIGKRAFYCCEELLSVNIPKAVTSFETETFRACRKLESITIPDGVASIGEYNQEIKGETNVEIIPVIA